MATEYFLAARTRDPERPGGPQSFDLETGDGGAGAPSGALDPEEVVALADGVGEGLRGPEQLEPLRLRVAGAARQELHHGRAPHLEEAGSVQGSSLKNCLKTVRKLSENCPKTVRKLSENCPKTVQKLSENCPKTVQKLSENCPKTVRKLSENCPKTVPKRNAPSHSEEN
jgi:hypothetical protein